MPERLRACYRPAGPVAYACGSQPEWPYSRGLVSLLRSRWRANTKYIDIDDLDNAGIQQDLASLKRYTPGWLLETIQFSQFTNVSGMKFPMVAEFRSFIPSTTQAPGRATQVSSSYALSIHLHLVEAQDTGPVSMPMVVGLKKTKRHGYEPATFKS